MEEGVRKGQEEKVLAVARRPAGQLERLVVLLAGAELLGYHGLGEGSKA